MNIFKDVEDIRNLRKTRFSTLESGDEVLCVNGLDIGSILTIEKHTHNTFIRMPNNKLIAVNYATLCTDYFAHIPTKYLCGEETFYATLSNDWSGSANRIFNEYMKVVLT